jgi:hypothetical protein
MRVLDHDDLALRGIDLSGHCVCSSFGFLEAEYLVHQDDGDAPRADLPAMTNNLFAPLCMP